MDTEGIGEADLTAAVSPDDGNWDMHGDPVADGFGADRWDQVAHLPGADPGHPGGDWAYPPGSMVVETPRGPELVGPPTVDSNNDGRPDTAVVPTSDGVLLITDVDGDGSADQIVAMDDSGAVTVSDHTDHGRWTVGQESQLDSQGRSGPAPGSRAVGTDDSDWVFDEITQVPPDQPGDSDSVWV